MAEAAIQEYRYPCASGDLGCLNTVPAGVLFCEDHWARLSPELQGRIVGAYQRYLQTMAAEDRAAWRAVRAEAVSRILEADQAREAK